MEGALDVGVNLGKYHELLQAMATQVGIARDNVASKEETQVLHLYEDSLSDCEDAEAIWRAKIDAAHLADMVDELWHAADTRGETAVAERYIDYFQCSALMRKGWLPAFPVSSERAEGSYVRLEVPADIRNLEVISKRQELPTVTYWHYAYISHDAVQLLWQRASKSVAKAHALCN
jgi:hypothetical protein